MALEFTSLAPLLAHGFDTVIDVRSPTEYAEDRIPGAINLPALDDAERARIGTIYKQDSPFLARKLGAALVARNIARHLEGPLAGMEGGWRPLVYCWRGGQRSGAFATWLREIGWRAETIRGGYRSYRRLVAAALYDDPFPAPVILIDGNTGSGKTDVLLALADRGIQTIDLEGLAHHRGSILGARDEDQPSQKGFESALAGAMAALDPARPVVIEAESSKIGARILPPGLWAAMCAAPVIELDVPAAARVRYLSTAYADLWADPGRYRPALDRFHRLQGARRVAEWQALAAAGDVAALTEQLIGLHYDPLYARTRSRHGRAVLARVAGARLDPPGIAALADRVAEIVRSR